jgi:hypothetical protein
MLDSDRLRLVISLTYVNSRPQNRGQKITELELEYSYLSWVGTSGVDATLLDY